MSERECARLRVRVFFVCVCVCTSVCASVGVLLRVYVCVLERVHVCVLVRVHVFFSFSLPRYLSISISLRAGKGRTCLWIRVSTNSHLPCLLSPPPGLRGTGGAPMSSPTSFH